MNPLYQLKERQGQLVRNKINSISCSTGKRRLTRRETLRPPKNLATRLTNFLRKSRVSGTSPDRNFFLFV